MLNAAGLSLPPMLLAGAYSLQVAGWFSLAQRVLGIPMSLIGDAVGKVYISECARLNHEPSSRLDALFWRTVRGQAAAALGVVALIALPAPLLFALVFGQEWAPAGWYLLLLSPMFVTKFVAFPVAGTLDVMQRQDLHVLRELVRLIAVSGAVLVGAAGKHDPLVTIGLLSMASSVSYLLGIIAVWHVITYRDGCHTVTQREARHAA
jgi:O-antigen/teichoic acid export membrane protein